MLKSFLLDQYGSRKTGLARAVTGGGAWVVDAGTTPLDEMIRDVKAGVLITRFSGGRPNDKGDFSGIAKNSYYIENGAIAYPDFGNDGQRQHGEPADEHRRDFRPNAPTSVPVSFRGCASAESASPDDRNTKNNPSGSLA